MAGNPKIELGFDARKVTAAFEYAQDLMEKFEDVELESIALFEGVSIMYTDTSTWETVCWLAWIEKHPVFQIGSQLSPETRRECFFRLIAQLRWERTK